MIKDSSDFIGKYVQLVTRNGTEIESELIAIETNGLLLKDTVEDNEGNNKDIFYFIPSNSIDHIYFDPESDY